VNSSQICRGKTESLRNREHSEMDCEIFKAMFFELGDPFRLMKEIPVDV
jgi:hypothetical protein